jgi:hypothetical protein
MNVHARFVLLVVGIAALAGLVMLLRAEAVTPQQSKPEFDVFLVLLGAGLIGVIISYIRALRAARALAAEGQVTGAQPPGASVTERLLGRRRSRVLDLVVFVVLGLVVLFLIGLLAYMLYQRAFS